MGILCLAACNRITRDDFYQNKLSQDSFFDFNTTDSLTISLDYGKMAAGSLVEFYADDPTISDDETGLTTDGEAFFKYFADSKGQIHQTVAVPSYADTVYVISRGFGTPFCLAGKIENGILCMTAPDITVSKASTKVVSSPSVIQKASGLYSIVDWSDDFGSPSDFNDIMSEGSIDPDMVKNLQYMLWGGSTTKSGSLNNSSYVRTTDHINTTIAKTYVDSQGQTVTTGSAQVFLTFLTEGGWYQNALGYYYYEAGKQPAKASSVKKFIIFPNASVTGNAPFGVQGYQYFDADKAPVSANTKVQLLYVDDDGNVSTHFPAGITIGYFIISNGFEVTENTTSSGSSGGGWWGWFTGHNSPGSQTTVTTYTGKLNTNGTYIYSDCEWNSKNKANFISLTARDNTLVYGVEDGGDSSFEDVLFTISATPEGAIQDPDKPVIDTDIMTRTASEITYRTYAFEDLWPYAGDYDMNDVVIEHTSSIYFDDDNCVSEVTDDFKVVNHIKSAELKDAFAVRISQRGSLTIPSGAVDETATGSVILFSNAQDHLGETFSINRKFASGELPKAALITDLDPFIIASSSERVAYTEKGRFEVHMPKKEGTECHNTYYYGQGSDAYYLDKDGKHPFAITIPLSSTDGSGLHSFTQAREMHSISEEYPRYDSWVESGGTKDTDWYLHYQEP